MHRPRDRHHLQGEGITLPLRFALPLAGALTAAAVAGADSCGFSPRERTVAVGGAPRLIAAGQRLVLVDGNDATLRLSVFDVDTFQPGTKAPARRTGPVFAAALGGGWLVVDTEYDGVPRCWRATAAGRISGTAVRLPGHGWPLALTPDRSGHLALLCLGGRDAAAPLEAALVAEESGAAARLSAASGARCIAGWAPLSVVADGEGFLVAGVRHTAGPGLTLARVSATGAITTLEATDEEVWQLALAEDGKRRWLVAMGPTGTHAWPVDMAGRRGKAFRLAGPGERTRRLLDARLVDGLLRIIWAEPYGLAHLTELSPKGKAVELATYHPRRSDVQEAVVTGDGAVFLWTTGFNVANVTSLHLEEEARGHPGVK